MTAPPPGRVQVDRAAGVRRLLPGRAIRGPARTGGSGPGTRGGGGRALTGPVRTTYGASTGTSPPAARSPTCGDRGAEHELDTWILIDDTPEHALRHRQRREAGRRPPDGVSRRPDDRPARATGSAWPGWPTTGWRGSPDSRCPGLRGAAPPAEPLDAARDGHGHRGPSLADGMAQLDRATPPSRTRVVVRATSSNPMAPSSARSRGREPCAGCARRHEVLVVEVGRPARARASSTSAPSSLVDPETGHRCEVWTSWASVRDELRRGATASPGSRWLRPSGPPVPAHLVLRTDQDWLRVLAGHVVATRRRGIRPRTTNRTSTDLDPRSTS